MTLRMTASLRLFAGIVLAAAVGCATLVADRGSGSPLDHSGLNLLLPLDGPARALPAAPRPEAGSPLDTATPSWEVYLNVVQSTPQDKIVGYYGTPPARNPIKWDEAFEPAFPSVEVSIITKRPPRPAHSLQAGDTFVMLKIYYEQFTGLTTSGGTYDSMNLIGGWLDARTVFNSFGESEVMRPYLQYGFGIVAYPEVLRTGGTPSIPGGTNWAASYKPAFHMSIGVEARMRRWGVFADVGVQTVAPPDTESSVYSVYCEAQDFLTYGVRAGLMLVMF
jgi:hypothetical protein